MKTEVTAWQDVHWGLLTRHDWVLQLSRLPFLPMGAKRGDFPKWAMQKGYKKVYKMEIGAKRGREVIRRGEWEMLER